MPWQDYGSSHGKDQKKGEREGGREGGEKKILKEGSRYFGVGQKRCSLPWADFPPLPPSLPLSSFFSKQYPPLPFWRRVVRLRLFSLLCLALAVPALVSRVVTLRTYCHLDGKIEEEVEGESAFKVRRERREEGREGGTGCGPIATWTGRSRRKWRRGVHSR